MDADQSADSLSEDSTFFPETALVCD